MKLTNSSKKTCVLLILTLFCNFLIAQPVEFREQNETSKITYWSNSNPADKDIKKELPPIAKKATLNDQYEWYYMLAYYDQATNDEIYKKVVEKKGLPYQYKSQGMLAQTFAKKRGEYEITYKEGVNKNQVFSYKISVNETVIYDDAVKSDREKLDGVISFTDFMFDHYENYFTNQYGFIASFSPYKLVYGQLRTQSQKAIKKGENVFKVEISYNGKTLGESTLTYTVNEFKLSEDNFCGSHKYVTEPDKSTFDFCKKKFLNGFQDDLTEKNYKLVSIYIINDSWLEFKEMSTGYPAERIKNFVVFISDSNNAVYQANMHIRQDYIGNGVYGDTYFVNGYKNLEDFFPIKKECFELIKAKYGTKN